jgi:8-oxo-dGTP pyrophosphatase MutT (NUDIX family)
MSQAFEEKMTTSPGKRASCVAAFNRRNGEALCATRRNKPDQLSFPGGEENLGESAIECAKREFFEETGIWLRDEPLLVLRDVDNTGYLNSVFLVVSQFDLQAIDDAYNGMSREIEPGIVVAFNPLRRLLDGPFGDFNQRLMARLAEIVAELLMLVGPLYPLSSTNPARHESKAGDVTAALRAMSQEQRLSIFSEFCAGCGSDDPKCTCRRDD